MNIEPAIELLGLLLAATAAYALTWRFETRMPKVAVNAAWIVSTIAVFFWLWLTVDFFTDFHWWSAYSIQLRSWWPIDWTTSLMGMWCALAQRRINLKHPPKGRFSRHNGVLLAWLLILPTFLTAVIPPEYEPQWYNEWKGDVCIQSTNYTCGAAVAATMLRRYGIEVSEEQAARKVWLGRQGTVIWNLARAMRREGLRTRAVYIGRDIESAPVPSILPVRIGDEKGIPHVMMIVGHTSGTLTLSDPQAGEFTWDTPRFFGSYHFSGVAIYVTQD